MAKGGQGEPRELRDGTAPVASLTLSLVTRRAIPRLVWRDAAGEHALDLDRPLLVGSAPHVRARVEEPTVSRLHAEIDPRPDGVWVRDLGSKNGTWIQGIRVQEARIPPGAPLRLGMSELSIAYDQAPAKVNLWPSDRFGPLHGRSEIMRELFLRLSKYAASDAPVLVHGETGTGKELVAEAVHQASARRTAPFVVVDCAALPDALLESELFGHARGAFTGAIAARAGAIESAEGGTVFLDEIGELPLAMQPKLLRVLESRTLRRVGEPGHRAVNVRFVAATHRDLQSMVASGAFREDLYFRLAVLPTTVPPLRARPGDILFLLEHLLGGVHVPLDATATHALTEYPWLGNVRELRNFAQRLRTLGPAAAITLLHGREPETAPASLPPPPPSLPPPPASVAPSSGLPAPRAETPFKQQRDTWVDHFEREYLRALLATHGRNVPAMAEAAELDPTYVRRLLRKHDL